MKGYKYFSVITGLFTSCLVISNILDTKLFQIGSFAFPSGIILFPIVYVFSDIFTEVYGYAQSRKAIWTGFFSLIISAAALEIGRRLPAAPFWANQASFDIIFAKVPRIITASIVAYFTGEFVNSLVIAKLKIIQKGKAMPFRFAASTLVGQAIDTSVFILVAFGGMMSFKEMIQVFLSAWIFKVSWEILVLPLSIILVKWLKRAENEDYYDLKTNFSPFKLS